MLGTLNWDLNRDGNMIIGGEQNVIEKDGPFGPQSIGRKQDYAKEIGRNHENE